METEVVVARSLIYTAESITIPFFQRGYVWTEGKGKLTLLKKFFEDIQTLVKEKGYHFMGAVILKKMVTESKEEYLLLIDGQQRLTTFVLFLKALMLHTPGFQEDWEKTVVGRKNRCRYQYSTLHEKGFEDIVRLRNIEEFNVLLNAQAPKPKSQKKANSTGRMLGAIQYFLKCIKEIDKARLGKFCDAAIEKLKFVQIVLEGEENEQQIFESLNSLGEKLTAAELFKNYLYDQNSSETDYITNWQPCFEGKESEEFWQHPIGSRKRANIDIFLQSLLWLLSGANSKYRKEDQLFVNFKRHIDQDEGSIKKRTLRTQLPNYAAIYRQIDPKCLENTPKDAKSFTRLCILIFGLKLNAVIPYVFYVLCEVKPEPEPEQEQEKIFSILLSYLIRKYISGGSKANLNNIFADFMGKNKPIKTHAALQNALVDRKDHNIFQTDEQLKKEFAGSFANRGPIAKTILYLIELGLHSPDLDNSKLGSFNEYEVEHIMPKAWRQHWGEPKNNEEERDLLLQTLGNFTLVTTKLNKILSNECWVNKRDALKKHSADVKILKKYLEVKDWNEDRIKERGEFLLEQALGLWFYPKELPKT